MINDQLKKYITNYKNNNINTLELIFGNNSNSNNIIFNKNMDQTLFYNYQSKFINYKNYEENYSVYNYNSNYCINKNHFTKQNINYKLINNNLLFIFYTKKIQTYPNFSCEKYNILKYKSKKYIINDELNIEFIRQNTNLYIKINMILNYNINNSITILDKLLSDF